MQEKISSKYFDAIVVIQNELHNFDAIAVIQHELHKYIQPIGFLQISIQTLWITNLIFQKEE